MIAPGASGATLKVMVLAGGPDRERPVSLASGQQVAEALSRGGHDVRLRDVQPDDLAALDEFEQWPGDALFLAMHGPWGEGGHLQRILDQRGLRYFGCRADAAALCMDKAATKDVLMRHDLPTPGYQVLDVGEPMTLPAPVVIKPLSEGSSFGVTICRDQPTADRVRQELGDEYGRLLVEQFVAGVEVTVGIIGGPNADEALPPVQIVPAAEFYDYDAKYARDDTQYLFDIDLPADVLDQVQRLALQAHRVCGCRDLSRVDFMIDRDHRPWIIEINTIPGFTSHSLVPKAAAHAGIAWEHLVDRLIRLAV